MNHNKDETQEESLARYGQPSEVIVLTGFPLSMSHDELRQTIRTWHKLIRSGCLFAAWFCSQDPFIPERQGRDASLCPVYRHGWGV